MKKNKVITVSEYLNLTQLISDSRNPSITGYRLAEIHRQLGEILGSELLKHYPLDIKKITILPVMRAGLYLAEGIWSTLPDASFIMIKDKDDISKNTEYISGNTIILVDSVINTGKTITPLIEDIQAITNNLIVATNVIYSKTLDILSTQNIITIRTSNNSYVGHGPVDTGNRIFNTY